MINQRISGLFGIIGGITLFIGDILFFYCGDQTNIVYNMGQISESRIIASAVASLLAVWFYLLGLGQIHYAFSPAKVMVRRVVVFCFGAILSAYGVVHAAYVAIATSAQISVQNQLELNETVALAIEANNTLRIIVYPVFAILSVLFIYQVWKAKTHYPKWMIFFFPLLPFLLEEVIGRLLTGAWYTIIMGGYLNLICIVFFLASTIALWNKQDTLPRE